MFEFYTHSFTLTLYTHSGEYNTQIEECKSLHHRSSITPSVILSVRLLCGTAVCTEGEPGHCFYVVLYGTLEVSQKRGEGSLVREV